MARARAVPFQLTSPPARTPAAPATAARAPAPPPEPLPSLLADVPVSGPNLERIAELVELVGHRYEGWGEEKFGSLVFVDVHPRRYHARRLREALDKALRDARGTP